MSNDTLILTVRGRKVAFRPSTFFGGLHAVERGYFPISHTGYRSLAGHAFADQKTTDPLTILTPEFLEALAVENDKSTKDTLTRATRALTRRLSVDPLWNFIGLHGDARQAFEYGFFATTEMRAPLWQAAFRIYHKIDSDPRCQPAPNAHAWTTPACERSLAEARTEFGALRSAIAGILPPIEQIGHVFTHAYHALPERPEGEPAIPVPAITLDLGFDFEASLAIDNNDDDQDEEDFDDYDEDGDDQELDHEHEHDEDEHHEEPEAPATTAQLSLF